MRRSAPLLLILGFALAPATGDAALPKDGSKAEQAGGKKKRGKKKRKEKQSKDDEQKRDGDAEPGDADLPPMTSYQIELEIQRREASIEADRTRGIKLLEEFIAKHSKNRSMPEALYRLASLYWERSQERFLTGMERWAARVDECKKDPEQCPEGPPAEPRLDLTDSQALYERLINEYPGFRKLDTVRYLYGFSLRDQGRVDEAQAQFWAIIKQHPTSSFVPDAWMAVGDHRFYGANDFNAALQAYNQVLAYPSSDAYAMALFKTAWCHWKLGQRELAIVRFKEVLDQASDPNQDAEGRKRLADLREEALEYLVQVLTEDETLTPKAIYDFLAEIGGAKYSRKVLARLAEAYEAQTRYDKSVPTYKFLIGLDGTHADNADFQIHVFIGTRGDAKVPQALDELEELHVQYGPKSAWGKAHPERSRKAIAREEKLLLGFARSLHESAQVAEKDTKVPDKDRYGLAARGYEDLMRRFPASPNAVETSYLVGDIYFFKLEKLEQAGDAYLRVGESAPVGKLHRDALMAAITAYEQVMAKGPISDEPPGADAAKPAAAPAEPAADATKPAPAPETSEAAPKEDDAGAEAAPADAAKAEDAGKDTAQAPGEPQYNRVERKFIRAIDLFAALFPKDEEIGAVVYKLGEFFYGREDYDAAVQRFGKVVVDYPESSNAGAAGDRILESLNKAQDYDNIELWAQKLKGAPSFTASDEQERLDRIIVESLLKQGESLASRGYYARAGSYYLRVAKEYPKHEQAAVALNNAGASLERAGRADAATAVYMQLENDYKGTPEAAEATLIVARVYENIADYEQAAVHYDRLVDDYPNHKERADSLYNSGVLYQALGQHKQAIARYQSYVKQYSSREDVVDVDLRVGQVHAQSGNHKAAVKAFSRFLKRHGRSGRNAEAYLWLGKSQLALGRNKAANKSLDKSVKAGRSGDAKARTFAAEARYLQGEVLYKSFEAAKLDSRPSKLGASLDKKAKLLGQAKNVYLDVLSLKSPDWSTAALYRIGEAYEKFGRGLREYPIPKGLSEEEETAYMEQLDTFALAFEEQAIEAYKGGYAKAVELRIYNEHTRKIRTALGRLSTQEYPPIEEIGTDLVVAEGGGRGGSPVRSLRR